jgi:hypothetical protein
VTERAVHLVDVIHNHHAFIEIHGQVFGRGRMQKFKVWKTVEQLGWPDTLWVSAADWWAMLPYFGPATEDAKGRLILIGPTKVRCRAGRGEVDKSKETLWA